jgi:plastocyanin
MDHPQQPDQCVLFRRDFVMLTGNVIVAAITTTLLAACGSGATVMPTPVPATAKVATPGVLAATQPATPQRATATAHATTPGATPPVPTPTPAMPAMRTAPATTTARASATSATASTSATNPTAAIAAVQIVDFAFVPDKLTVAVGTTVVWTNTGVEHTTTSSDGVWGSEVLERGDAFRYTFTQPGTYPYICGLHPDMQAIVIVQ